VISTEGKTGRYCRSALFVDFDNVYLRLEQQDAALANSFATQPGQWVDWLEHALPTADSDTEATRRKILVRRCYLNPRSFGRYRAYFFRSAFETIDCPALTAQGKTSADVYMVLDILDLLTHQTFYDEFILLSADADFTPVLLKLRKHDRRTAILAIGPSSLAYLTASDVLINQEDFLTALSVSEEEVSPVTPPAREARGMSPQMRDELLRVVKEQIAAATAPVALAALAQRFRSMFPNLGADWGGFGTFNGLLSELDLSEFGRSHGGPGYLYDPERHTPPTDVGQQQADSSFARDCPQMAEVAKRVAQLTATPYLSPAHYAKLFELIATEVNANGYHMTRVSKAVRDECKQDDIPITRQQINFVLRGIAFIGHRFGNHKESAHELAKLYYRNTLNLCSRAQLDLAADEEELIALWLTGQKQAGAADDA